MSVFKFVKPTIASLKDCSRVELIVEKFDFLNDNIVICWDFGKTSINESIKQ
ncbi:hypothetical protein A3Q56_07915 [Intoshia linei]|uniref:Uncharacterized protein n=1 Tax=Intoshia linei TaxID=1819745 RepID=A0A177AQV8_9BILA|nr:hypothetical protein A3Q56_07915 [Intoshia linei]